MFGLFMAESDPDRLKFSALLGFPDSQRQWFFVQRERMVVFHI